MAKEKYGLAIGLGIIGMLVGSALYTAVLFYSGWMYGVLALIFGALAGGLTAFGYKKQNKGGKSKAVYGLAAVFGLLAVALGYIWPMVIYGIGPELWGLYFELIEFGGLDVLFIIFGLFGALGASGEVMKRMK